MKIKEIENLKTLLCHSTKPSTSFSGKQQQQQQQQQQISIKIDDVKAVVLKSEGKRNETQQPKKKIISSRASETLIVPEGCIPLLKPLTREATALLVGRTLDLTFGPQHKYTLIRALELKTDTKIPEAFFMFQCQCEPTISIEKFMNRFLRCTSISAEAMLAAMFYIACFHCRFGDSFPLNILTIHRLVAVSLLCSAKYFDDEHQNNSNYAKVAGVTRDEINVLEIEFLLIIKYDLHITMEVYNRIYSEFVLQNPLLSTILYPFDSASPSASPSSPSSPSVPSYFDKYKGWTLLGKLMNSNPHKLLPSPPSTPPRSPPATTSTPATAGISPSSSSSFSSSASSSSYSSSSSVSPLSSKR